MPGPDSEASAAISAGAQPLSGAWARQLAGGSLIALAFALGEWLLTWGEPVQSGAALRATTLALMVALWTSMAWVWTAAAAWLTWPWLPATTRSAARARMAGAIHAWWHARGTAPDAQRLAALLATLAGVGVQVVGSVAIIAYLVEHRHGAVLIAITAVAGQLLLAVGTYLLARLLRGLLNRLLPRLPSSLRRAVVNAPVALLLLGGLVIAGSSWSGWHFRQTVLATDLLSGLAPLLAMAVHVALGALFSRRMPAGRWVHLQPLVALALLVAASQSGPARGAVLQLTDTSKYVYAAIARAGDLDDDGSTSFPYYADCAPLDAAVHPYAFEIDGNGRDDNCDGSDALPTPTHAPWKPHSAPQGPKPNLVLVTFDATRADHMGFLGYRRNTTPGLSKVAASAVTFDNAFSQDSGTGPSFWSLMAGKTPFQTTLKRADRFPPRLGEGERLLAEVLHDGGYYTEAVLCGHVFSKKDWGIQRGFDRYENVCGKRDWKVAPIVTGAAIKALKRARKKEPFFLWVHYYDPHAPYSSHGAKGFGNEPMDNYDEEIRYADRHLQRFLERMDRSDRGRPRYLFFGADHGENFSGRDGSHHARTLYREVTNVPLLVAGPGLTPRRVHSPVALNDLYPTLIELAQLRVPDSSTMVSLVPVLRGDDPTPGRLIFQENSYSRPRRHVKAVVSGRYHLILDTTGGTTQLYDHIADPLERVNLVGRGLPAEKTLHSAVMRFLATTRIPDELKK